MRGCCGARRSTAPGPPGAQQRTHRGDLEFAPLRTGLQPRACQRGVHAAHARPRHARRPLGQQLLRPLLGGSAIAGGQQRTRHRGHAGFLQPECYDTLDREAQHAIEDLVRLHEDKTASTRATWLLANWGELATRFVRLTPKPQA